MFKTDAFPKMKKTSFTSNYIDFFFFLSIFRYNIATT